MFSLIPGSYVVPGGETDASNCQILQARVNRYKSNKDDVDKSQLQNYSCDLKFTGLPFCLLDMCFAFEIFKRWSASFADKELDVIEMAVYGNVIRPGLQCRCKSVAETLGTALSKSKGPEVLTCKLPYKQDSSSS